MNKIGTKKSYEQEELETRLNNSGINDDKNISLELGASNYLVGEKTETMYINFFISGLTDSQAHGSGDFDIRYYILRNLI